MSLATRTFPQFLIENNCERFFPEVSVSKDPGMSWGPNDTKKRKLIDFWSVCQSVYYYFPNYIIPFPQSVSAGRAFSDRRS